MKWTLSDTRTVVDAILDWAAAIAIGIVALLVLACGGTEWLP